MILIFQEYFNSSKSYVCKIYSKNLNVFVKFASISFLKISISNRNLVQLNVRILYCLLNLIWRTTLVKWPQSSFWRTIFIKCISLNYRYVYTFNQLSLIYMEKLNLQCFVRDIQISRKQNYEMVLRVKIFH